jgi:hypothetical protein
MHPPATLGKRGTGGLQPLGLVIADLLDAIATGSPSGRRFRVLAGESRRANSRLSAAVQREHALAVLDAPAAA